MDLRQLEYFQTVSQLNSFTKAAKKLHVAQPSITTAIAKLETDLGIRLFDRAQKKIALTAEGRIFLDRVDTILREVDETLAQMHDLKNLNTGTIRAAIPPMIGAYLFPDIFTNFKKTFPNLDLLVFEEGSLAARIMIDREEVDLGIIILPEADDTLNILPIIDEEIVVCLPIHHPLSTRSSIAFTDLQQEQLIMLKEDSYHHKTIMDNCHKNNIIPRIVFSSSQIQTIKALVASGSGISFLMKMVVQDNSHITSVPLQPAVHIKIGLAWKKDKYLSKASQAFINFIASTASKESFK